MPENIHGKVTRLSQDEDVVPINNRGEILMLKLFYRFLCHHDVVHFIPRLPIGLEISDGDKAALYGWPDKTIQEIIENEQVQLRRLPNA